MIEQTLETN